MKVLQVNLFDTGSKLSLDLFDFSLVFCLHKANKLLRKVVLFKLVKDRIVMVVVKIQKNILEEWYAHPAFKLILLKHGTFYCNHLEIGILVSISDPALRLPCDHVKTSGKQITLHFFIDNKK